MAKLKVMCARSMHVAVSAIGEAFAGHEIDFDFGTVGAIQARLDKGETADVLIVSGSMLDALEKSAALVPGTRRNVATTFIAVCAREGAALPDFSSAEAFKSMLERASAVAMSDPAVGGSAAVYIPTVLERLGLTAAMKPKSLLEKNGVEVARRVVEGRAAFGLTLSGEVASVPGAVIAGPLPQPFGLDTTYCGAVTAASGVPDAGAALLAALTAPETRAIWEKCGFQVP